MKPDQRFTGLDKAFWAHVRSISQKLGYTDRKTKEIKVPTLQNLADALSRLSLSSAHLSTQDGRPSDFARNLHGYFACRAEVLNRNIRPLLMNAAQAGALFKKLRKDLRSKTPIPMNKQKSRKRKPAFLTGKPGRHFIRPAAAFSPPGTAALVVPPEKVRFGSKPRPGPCSAGFSPN